MYYKIEKGKELNMDDDTNKFSNGVPKVFCFIFFEEKLIGPTGQLPTGTKKRIFHVSHGNGFK